jgi:hypothetical protein
VRDGNEHRLERLGRDYPSTWGAVEASFAMPLSETRFFAFVPSEPPQRP